VLRQAIADRYEARGLPTNPDQIMVTIGAQHAIALLARTLMGRGDHALVESPSYPHAFEALRSAGARLVPVAVTSDEGWDEQAFEQAIQRTSPSVGYLMPDFHNPTGQSMSPEFRERALTLAARHGTALVADETMAELGFDGRPPALPFAAYGEGGRESLSAILIGSVGKSVWGGLRIGWIRAERSVIQRLARARPAGDLGTPVLEQLVVADLLSDYDTILTERRTYLRQGRDRLETLLAERFPDWRVPHVPGGLTTWVNLGAPLSSQLTLAARTEGLHIAAGPLFGTEGAFDRFLRIPFSYSAVETERAMDALAAAWRTVARYPAPENTYLAEVV
jgi:DNA-binding transcriptional MocR family regulator